MLEIDRRAFLVGAGAIAAMRSQPALADTDHVTPVGWEREPMRWFQLAFTEDDPGRFDPDFWMDYFREIRAEGVCLSAGGAIAFYPTQIPYHGMSANMDGQDPFGMMAERCAAEGIRVIARIDPHAMSAEAFAAHPERALRARDGSPRPHATADDLYLTCSFGPQSTEFLPQVFDEVTRLYPVDGFFGNRWRRFDVCYCETCQRLFRDATGRALPANNDPRDADVRLWADWSERRMLHIVDIWNETVQRHRRGVFFTPGGDRTAVVNFDGRAVGDRLPIVFADRQARSRSDLWFATGTRAWSSGLVAKEMRSYMHDKPVGHIVSVGVEEQYRWKDSVQSEPEIRIWAAGSLAHGARPWITKFNAKPFDRRWMRVVSDVYRWHARHERYFRNTANLARIALVEHTLTASYQGGLDGRRAADGHRQGFYQALLEAGIVFDMIDDAFLDAEHLARFDLLILANAALLSDAQCEQLRAFVARGGSIVATHETSLYDETGERRGDFALADLFGCHYDGVTEQRMQNAYLTLRHPHESLAGLEDVARTVASVKRVHVRADGAAQVPLTLVPSYADLPMERVFTDVTETDIPMALCRSFESGGRVVYLPMDLDRTFDELALGDHLRLLAGMVRWAAPGAYPMQIAGPGLVDIAYWEQDGSRAAHLVNLNNPMTMNGSYREVLPSGPYEVTLALPAGARPQTVRLLEADTDAAFDVRADRLLVTVPQIGVHEIVAIDLA